MNLAKKIVCFKLCVFLFVFININGCKKNIQEVKADAYTIHKDSMHDAGYRQQGLKLLSETLNPEIKNLKISKDMENGKLIITFDYPSQKWLMGTLMNTPKNFLIRLFDKNGNILTYFETKETYVSERLYSKLLASYQENASPEAVQIQFQNVYPIKPHGNNFMFSVSLKDLEYLEHVEFGINETKFTFSNMIE